MWAVVVILMDWHAQAYGRGGAVNMWAFQVIVLDAMLVLDCSQVFSKLVTAFTC
eukprot:gene316-21764_t